jgi:uncharacterized membrane protein
VSGGALTPALTGLTLAAAVGSGISAGIFFAFSSFVMAALARLPAAQGIAAMQAINVTVINPWFFTAFFGPAAVGAGLAVVALAGWGGTGGAATAWLVAGAAVYVVGCIAVTALGNVPLNDALAAVDPVSADGAELWRHYLPRWSLWNHVRTVACAVATAAFALALRFG